MTFNVACMFASEVPFNLFANVYFLYSMHYMYYILTYLPNKESVMSLITQSAISITKSLFLCENENVYPPHGCKNIILLVDMTAPQADGLHNNCTLINPIAYW